ncbi:SGNH hydrolase-type esterase domain-containing protein [Cokeromyces recurvatus]|uniref:SGNH hydrolase-type esterase domain-containing protein n=1 Tax=Cokeromyces recurvatus TaxID=90255 RepID=UPI0022208CB7|nr:SGNH hydrolase-type esterase domain-containing protein [Cokeromyces recurvatus]KAI7901119.1 SGNH hydrolase-type esterase domain-containing protein [Cokeromyces recurvatus]
MYKVTSLLVLALGAFTTTVMSLNVTNIKDCPALTPRTSPTSVHDLRPDDIKVVGALGDSITAGYGIMGYNYSLPPLIATLESYYEYRGLSYSIGGDENALTIPNYVKHYQPNVTGYSTDRHIVEYCNAFECVGIYQPHDDQLNAAQSGAIAMNLEHELNYLIARLRTMKGINFQNDWKMINIQIGSNDMCGACNSSYMDEVTPEKYGNYVASAIETIQAKIPNVLVNLIGTFNVSEVFPLTAGQSYCQRRGQNSSTEGNIHSCSCGGTPEGLELMSNLSKAYNEKLYNIYEKYQQNKMDNFTVVYQQSNINISGFPINFFSDLDCFHPSLMGHQWVSKIIWNQLFTKQDMKPRIFNFNVNETIYCPIDSDRIATN